MPNQAVEQIIASARQLEQVGRRSEAEQNYQSALRLHPDHPGVLHELGMLLNRTGREREGLALVRRSLELAPNVPEFLSNFGALQAARGDQATAAKAFARAIELRPEFAGAHANLGSTLLCLDRVGEAVESFRRAIALGPTSKWHILLAAALMQLGQTEGAVAASRRAVELGQSPTGPSDAAYHSGLLFAMLHDAASTTRTVYEEHLAWAERHARPLYPARPQYDNDRTPGRRLRVGYVSADFREHTRARFVAPLLSHHDRRQFEVFCYSSVVRPDAVTASSRAAADCWREVRGMDDAALAELVRRDRIDVLVELTGHMGGNLLKLFARKPAPVQVAYPGYPATTALATIDALITDADRDPFDCAQDRRAGAKSLYTEPLVRLAVTSQCYRPPVDVPEVGDLPALRHGHVTFGVTNKLAKVTGATARCWSRIVAAVPGSRLLVITPGNPADQETVRSFFVGHGVPPERLDLVGRRQGRSYWELYGRIDIGLDTFPYNGHTTTLDGLWMGVPTVTLAGGAHVSREGLAVCRLMNLEDLVAWDEEHYKAITVRLVRHLPRLASLRYELRGRMAASPLRDEAGVTRRVESAYRRLWERWCGA